MKSGNIVVALAGFVIVLGIGYAFVTDHRSSAAAISTVTANEPCCSEEGEAGAVCEPKTDGIIQVDDLAAEPENYQGDLVLKAAVVRVNEAEGIFAVLDYREFKQCRVLDCAKRYLPVKFSGDIPGPETLVQMTGQVVEGEKGLIFKAKTLEVIE